MATHASRDTTTGLRFEEKVTINKKGYDLSKHNLYRYLQKKGLNWEDYLSKKLLPDEAYYDPEGDNILWIYEKKYQATEGSADEKPQTCAFKIWEFRKIAEAIGASDVRYTYVFNNWFNHARYKDMLEYIRSVEGCDYFFAE